MILHFLSSYLNCFCDFYELFFLQKINNNIVYGNKCKKCIYDNIIYNDLSLSKKFEEMFFTARIAYNICYLSFEVM